VCVDTSKDYTALIQGLPGRLCGHHNYTPILMCPIKPIEQYLKLIGTNYEYTSTELYWKSHSVQKERKFIRSKPSYISRNKESIQQQHDGYNIQILE